MQTSFPGFQVINGGIPFEKIVELYFIQQLVHFFVMTAL